MTWIRIDCDLRDHKVVGLLAAELHIDTDRAFALYLRTLLGFGEHQVDGRPEAVAAATLEEWARWKGKVGRYAAAFQVRCVEDRDGGKDPVGTIRGWWRQRALLEKQAKDAAKRKSPENPPETPEEPPRNPRGFSSESWGNVDVDVNEQRTTQSVGPADDPPAPAGSDVAKLLTGMRRTVDRWAVFNFLERVPDPELAAWTARLAVYLQGVDFPAGVCPTPEQLATACRDFTGDLKSPAHFRAFVMRAINGPRPHTTSRRDADKTGATLAAVDRFVKGGA